MHFGRVSTVPDNDFTRPTLTEIVERVQTDLNSRLSGFPGFVDSRIGSSLLFVLAFVIGGISHLLHGHIEYVARQIIPDTARSDFLERWASFWGRFREVADFANGGADFTGVNGTDIPAGTEVQYGDGTLLTVDSLVTVAGGVAFVNLTAAEAGSSGNATGGTFVELVSPIPGIDSPGIVASAGITGGLDKEEDPELLRRLELRVQEPPQGGADADYVLWALERDAPGSGIGTDGHGIDVDRAFVSPAELGAGTVVVRFTTGPGGIAPPIPDAAEVTAVDTHMQIRKPVTAKLTVLAPVDDPIPLTITAQPNGDADVENEITSSLQSLFAREAVPGGTLKNSRIREAISAADGETSHTLDSVDGGSGLDDIVSAAGDLASLGVITFA